MSSFCRIFSTGLTLIVGRDQRALYSGNVRHQYRRPIRSLDQYVPDPNPHRHPLPIPPLLHLQDILGADDDVPDDIFISTLHRVLPPPVTRYSIPFFFGCDHEVPLIPPDSCGPPKYEVITAGKYVKMRLSEIYAETKEVVA